MQEQAAICEICGDTIYVEIERERDRVNDWLSGFSQAAERAAAAHIATHPTPEVERFLLRKHLDEIAPEVRPAAVKQIYADLRALWGDSDTRGLYTIDDVVSSASVYRMWLDAQRCTWDHCQHNS
jgi:hypothetical protein